jgi:hypothetical protein
VIVVDELPDYEELLAESRGRNLRQDEEAIAHLHIEVGNIILNSLKNQIRKHCCDLDLQIEMITCKGLVFSDLDIKVAGKESNITKFISFMEICQRF